MTPDRSLSKNFTLYDLTRTDHTALQEDNRNVTDEEIVKLGHVATDLLEPFVEVLGPLDVHSGRRSPKLNAAVGSKPTSQHMRCEAADSSPKGPDTEASIEAAFEKLLVAARAGKFKFGQLIIESAAAGREGRKFWIHGSLGAPYRDPARCGEVFRIVDGKTTFVEKIAQ